jgi:hypothetical protein
MWVLLIGLHGLSQAHALRVHTPLSEQTAAAGCTVDEDCSLNGVCTGNACACDKPWTGPQCGELDFLPAAVEPAYGGATNATLNYSTWGGNPVYKDGIYHLFVARVPGMLAMWYKTSQIDYATSPHITGPYAFQSVVLPAFAHNPQIVHQNFKNGTERFVLFHIGHGGIHAADTPEGPFAAVQPANWSCDNPAPYWDAGEETWYLTCRTKKHGMRTAKHLGGPWTQIGLSPPEPPAGPDTWCEDPYLYRDARGNWHALFHAVNLKVLTDCGSSPVSSHAFSRDLQTWKTLATYVQPFSSVVALADGSARTLASVERPKFFFNAQGQPTHLFNGAANVPQCGGNTSDGKRPNSCSDCKYVDHTNTIVRPLNV